MGSHKKKKKKKKTADERVDIGEFIALSQELADTKKKYGVEEKEGPIKRFISYLFEQGEKRQKVLVSKKKYIVLAVFTGWIGGHRWFVKQYRTAMIYTLLFWCGFPLAMTLVDLMIVIPMTPDDNGMILI